MSAYHQIFLRTSKPEHDLISIIGVASGAELEQVKTSPESVMFGVRAGNFVIEVEFEHDFGDDFGISFSRYPIVITIRDVDSNKNREAETAKSIFDDLCTKGVGSLVLVFNLSTLLAECNS